MTDIAFPPVWMLVFKFDYFFCFGMNSTHAESNFFLNKQNFEYAPIWIIQQNKTNLRNILIQSRIKSGLICTLFDEIYWWDVNNYDISKFIIGKNDIIADLNLEKDSI